MSSAEPRAVDCDVLVLGASFAGIELLHQLRRSRLGRVLDVVFVDRQIVHPYIPLAHELVCERQKNPDAAVLRTGEVIDADPRARMVEGEVRGADSDFAVRVDTREGEQVLRGRFVVVALGSTIAAPAEFDGHEHFLTHKFDLPQSEARTRCAGVLSACDTDSLPRAVVVGGGITGVEIAGELAHLGKFDVTLIDGGPRLLRGLHPRASAKARRCLEGQNVALRMNTEISAHDGESIVLTSGERMACELAFWAGGVRPPPVIDSLGLPTTEAGWLAVAPTLQCFPRSEPADPAASVFAIGDIARICGGEGEWQTMQRAIECLWQAKTAARNILAVVNERPLWPHRSWEDFPHGVSVGARSLVVYGRLTVDGGGLAVWFRRWLMARYMARYA